MRQPPGQPRDRKENGEHVRWDAHGLVNQAGVEVDVWVQLFRLEVVVGESDLLQLHCHVNQRVGAGERKNIVQNLADDLGARVVRLVDLEKITLFFCTTMDSTNL